jgi:hypothetical protein
VEAVFLNSSSLISLEKISSLPSVQPSDRAVPQLNFVSDQRKRSLEFLLSSCTFFKKVILIVSCLSGYFKENAGCLTFCEDWS